MINRGSSDMTGSTVEVATQAAQVASQAAPHDPLLVGLAWVLGIVTLLIAIGKPIRDYLRTEKRADKVDLVS